jgi:hypothetical protein
MDSVPPKSVAFSDKVIAVSPPESVCSVRGRSTGAPCPKKSVSTVIYTLVILMFGLSIMYLISRIIALQRKLAKLELAQRNSSYDLADVVEEKVQSLMSARPSIQPPRVTPPPVPKVPLPGRASTPPGTRSAAVPPVPIPVVPPPAEPVVAAAPVPPTPATPPKAPPANQVLAIPFPIMELFLADGESAFAHLADTKPSTSFVEELSESEASGTEVTKAVATAMAPLADVVREMEKVIDDDKRSSSSEDEDAEARQADRVVLVDWTPPKPAAKRGRPKKKTT